MLESLQPGAEEAVDSYQPLGQGTVISHMNSVYCTLLYIIIMYYVFLFTVHCILYVYNAEYMFIIIYIALWGFFWLHHLMYSVNM